MSLDENLSRVLDRKSELESLLADPGSLDSSGFRTLSMELSELVPVAEKVTALRQVRAELEEARTLVRDETDPEMCRMAEEEVR